MDVAAHRRLANYTLREKWARAAWAACGPLFRASPRLLPGWRNFLLRRFGAEVGRDVRVHPDARIFAPWNLRLSDEVTVAQDVRLYALGTITLGPRTMVSQGAHLCAGTHDLTDPARPLLKLPIVLGADTWVCADAFVGPGVTLGPGCVAGARAVVVRSFPEGSVVAGNPARLLRQRPTPW